MLDASKLQQSGLYEGRGAKHDLPVVSAHKRKLYLHHVGRVERRWKAAQGLARIITL